MTELIDLLPPTERLHEVFKQFIDRLEEEHIRKEKRLDNCFEHYRRKIHRGHLKIQSNYKSLFDTLIRELHEDKDIPILQFLERAMRSEDRGIYEKVVRTTMPSIESVEKEGGYLEIACKRHDVPRAESSCLYPGDGYFSFLEEFMDGYDDNTFYRVVTETKDEKEKRCEKKEKELEWYASRDPSNFAARVRVDIQDLLDRGATSVPDVLKNEPSNTLPE